MQNRHAFTTTSVSVALLLAALSGCGSKTTNGPANHPSGAWDDRDGHHGDHDGDGHHGCHDHDDDRDHDH